MAFRWLGLRFFTIRWRRHQPDPVCKFSHLHVYLTIYIFNQGHKYMSLIWYCLKISQRCRCCKGYNDTCTYSFLYHTLHQPESPKLTSGPRLVLVAIVYIVYSYIQKSLFYSDAFSSLTLIHHTYVECLNYFSWNLLTGKGRKRAKEITNRGVRILLCQLIPWKRGFCVPACQKRYGITFFKLS